MVTGGDSGPLAEAEDRVFQIHVDEDHPEAARVSSAGWWLLLVSVAFSLLAIRAGLNIFFLPLIFPLGFGGAAALRRLLRRVRPRVLHLERGVLSYATRGPFGTRRHAKVDVSRGVHVSLQADGAGLTGRELVSLRVAAGEESFAVPAASEAHARRLGERLVAMLEEARVAVTTS